MAIDKGTRTGPKDAAPGQPHGRTGQEVRQDTAEQRQNDALEEHRGNPSAGETQVRREQGGHDRPVGADHKPHPRPTPEGGKQAAQGRGGDAARSDPKAGLDREVGDLEDPDMRKDGALPGRAGGGLAGG